MIVNRQRGAVLRQHGVHLGPVEIHVHGHAVGVDGSNGQGLEGRFLDDPAGPVDDQPQLAGDRGHHERAQLVGKRLRLQAAAVQRRKDHEVGLALLQGHTDFGKVGQLGLDQVSQPEVCELRCGQPVSTGWYQSTIN